MTASPMQARKVWIGIAVAALAITVCGWTVTNWERLRPYDWKSIGSQDAQFRVAFPRNPVASQESTTASDGSKFLSNRLISSPAHGVSFAVSWWENPSQKDKSTDELFADFRDCYINVFHGRIVGENEVNVDGYPAKDTMLFTPDGLAVANRVIRVGPRLYSLWVLDSTASHLDITSARRFFSSFSVRRK
jgi:hypothetical protein